MAVTVLAILFLIFIALIAVFGYKAFVKTGKPAGEIDKERCALCRQPFDKGQLFERQIGDYKMLYFCRHCIEGLHADLTHGG